MIAPTKLLAQAKELNVPHRNVMSSKDLQKSHQRKTLSLSIKTSSLV